MPILSKQQLLRNPAIKRKSYEEMRRELRSGAFKKNPADRYDIFLSHRSEDAEIIYSLKLLLEDFGFSVFVDWIETPQADRSKVNPETAAMLRFAMRQSDSLLYAASENARESKWMPWELGYSDALHGKVAVLPISQYETAQESYIGQEYLGLYPYITLTPEKGGEEQLWVNKTSNNYVSLNSWINGAKIS